MKDIAVVGAGRWGQNLARNFFNLERLGLICDSDPAVLDHCENTWPAVPTATSFEAALAHPGINAFVLATPANTHHKLGLMVLASGRDLFVEKPLALSRQHAKDLMKAALEVNAVLFIGHQLQHHPAIAALTEHISAGAIGPLDAIVSHRMGHGQSRSDCNVLWDLAVHDVGLALRLFQRAPKSVKATASPGFDIERLTSATFHLEFHPGDAEINVSWRHPQKLQQLVVKGAHGEMRFDDLSSTPLVMNRTGASQPTITVLSVPDIEPLLAHCQRFLYALKTRERPLTDGAFGLMVATILEAAEASLLSGQPIVMPPWTMPSPCFRVSP